MKHSTIAIVIAISSNFIFPIHAWFDCLDTAQKSSHHIFNDIKDVNELTILDIEIQLATLTTFIQQTRKIIAILSAKAQEASNKQNILFAEETDSSKSSFMDCEERIKKGEDLTKLIDSYRDKIKEEQKRAKQAEAKKEVLEATINLWQERAKNHK